MVDRLLRQLEAVIGNFIQEGFQFLPVCAFQLIDLEAFLRINTESGTCIETNALAHDDHFPACFILRNDSIVVQHLAYCVMKRICHLTASFPCS